MPGVETAGGGLAVRRATAADAGALADMRAASAYERHGGDVAVRDAYVRDCTAFFARQLSDPQSFLQSWVAYVDRNVVAGASLTIASTLPRYGVSYSGVDGRVRDVFVMPAHRRRGIAHALMRVVIAAAKEMNVDRLTLGASQMGAPLYLALGFVYKSDEMVYARDE